MLYGHLGQVRSLTAVGGVHKPRREKHPNFVLEIAHFAANVICVRKISRVLKSEGERSLVPFEPFTDYKVLRTYQRPVSSSSRYRAAIEFSRSKSSGGAALARVRSASFD